MSRVLSIGHKLINTKYVIRLMLKYKLLKLCNNKNACSGHVYCILLLNRVSKLSTKMCSTIIIFFNNTISTNMITSLQTFLLCLWLLVGVSDVMRCWRWGH